MIIDCKKYLFVGAKEDLIDFFLRAQEEGFIEFLKERKKGKELPEDVRQFSDAIKILRKQPLKTPYQGGGDILDAEEVAAQIIELKEEIEKLSEEERFLQSEIARVSPFGDFSFDDIAFIEQEGNKKVQFYCVKTSKAHEIEDAPSLIYVGTDYELDYYIGIHDRPKSYPLMIEMQVERTAHQLKNHLAFVSETLHQVEAELKGYAGHIDFLRDALVDSLDIHNFKEAKGSVDYPIEGAVFTIEGWVPENKTDKLWPLIEGKAVFFEPIAIEKEDRVPTYMENQNANLVGEDLVRIYDVPAHSDKDPSGWVIWSFLLFFAMIVADGGYGLLYLGLAFFLKHKFPDIKGAKKRLLKLFFMLSTTTIIWGVCTSGVFGIQFGPESPLSKVSILTHLGAKKVEYHKAKNDETYKQWTKEYPAIQGVSSGREAFQRAVKIDDGKKTYKMLDSVSDGLLLEISLLIGVIHISLSLLRYFRRNWANLGWVSFAVGGYLFFPTYLKATSMVEFLGFLSPETAAIVGLQLLYGGIGGAIALGVIQKGLKGLGEIPQIIQVFADILSYLRLYALALASSIMARTFNEMGMGVGLIGGSIIILAGHLLNMQLAVMGGVIHGLRLNFIEWYHYSFDGEGKSFNPLRKLKQLVKQE